MNYSNNIWHIVILIGGVQGLILGMFLLFRASKKNFAAYRLLSILLFSVSIDMVFTYLSLSGMSEQYPSLISVTDPLYALLGPLIYLFVQALLSVKFVFKKVYILFFIPFFIEIIFFSCSSPEDKLYTLYSLQEGGSRAVDFAFFWALELIFNLGMVIAAILVLRRYNKRLKDYVSEIGKLSLNYLRNFIFLTMLFLLFQFVFLLFVVVGFSSIVTAFIFSYSLMAICFYVISYWALTDPEIFLPATIEQMQTTSLQKVVKYQKNPLQEKRAELLVSELIQLMEEEKLFLNNGIKLSDIAKRLSVSTNNVSQIINQNLGKNFYDLTQTSHLKKGFRKAW
jgi:hypothetical protein